MPPRLRAREPARESPETEHAGENASLCSFFPLEIVREIHRYLDLPSLASVALTSFGCLEAVSGDLYRHVVVSSEKGLISFASESSSKLSARLVCLLSLAQVRTLELRPGSGSCNTFVATLEWRRNRPLPRRLASHAVLSLERLLVVFNGADATLGLYVYPYLNPVHLDCWSQPTRQQSQSWLKPKYSGWHLTGTDTWSALRSLSAVGWVPIYTDEGTCILHDLPWVVNGGHFELEVDGRAGSSTFKPAWLNALTQAGGVALEGLQTRLVILPGSEQRAKGEMAKLTEEQKARIELVVQST